MRSKDEIIGEIKRLASELGRTPGRDAFEKRTGIRTTEWWGIYWRSWGAAVQDAGLTPNRKNDKLSSNDVLAHYVDAVRYFQRLPAVVDLRMYAKEKPGFPAHNTFFSHFETQAGLRDALARWIADKPEFDDIRELLPDEPASSPGKPATADGYVYLLKSGAHFKIGRSDNLERRIKEVSISLPEATTLEHAIKTDDPVGIEAYWHNRFAEKRAGGEWFKLTAADLRAFKRRSFQ
ncbi:MAG: GIY-YIG nuclease family protein [Oceanicaulis sp.]|uniref:GIY-YIG nuclease family protein n=1 Tax=Glycocaulis sp. TaxID=1969725 RepID=UPI0025C6E304|nr:GIY-YIG nuclease family protein [Glycocaulis sp.]MCC5982071.1 GIY-YIG nuclease family protein [Oceanicaulis sp.]MCH8521815.1 GIY-YIG nuclease family protein [Glycocaulis sp.]